jgi:flagellar biosynthesis component FlhA
MEFSRKSNLLGLKDRFFDFGLAVVVIAVVVMMIVPLIPWLLDLLISLNLAISLIVLALSLFIKRPLAFSAFPSLLLVATLYRLALNISSTRLILIRADAGRVIGGFGGFVVGGDILVGAVIFGILSMVLFLVITKGAERVAEVAARFSLDALPGFQLAIDSDLRAGAISPLEASRKRAELDRQSRYYGALDGSMKFVRGDAIAGIVIICVNIVGGISVGILRHGMSIGQALDTYGRLTIGDGLVTMIPALLISTAAGMLVTRVGQGGDTQRLGARLGGELFGEPRALGTSAVLMIIMAFVPGLPAWPFLSVGAALGGISYFQFGRERRRSLLENQEEGLDSEQVVSEGSTVLEIGNALWTRLSPQARSRGGWHMVGRSLASGVRRDLGLPISIVPIVTGIEGLPDWKVQFRLRGIIAGQLTLPSNRQYDREKTVSLDHIIAVTQQWLRRRAAKLVGIDETQILLDKVARTRPVLVRETVPKRISLPALSGLLGELVDEGISLDYLSDILHVLSRIPSEIKSHELLEQVRRGISHLITANVQDEEGNVGVLTLGRDLEGVLHSGLITTSTGQKLVLPPDILGDIVEAIGRVSHDMERPVLLVTSKLRRPFFGLFAAYLPKFAVVAHNELEPHVPVEVIAKVEVG